MWAIRLYHIAIKASSKLFLTLRVRHIVCTKHNKKYVGHPILVTFCRTRLFVWTLKVIISSMYLETLLVEYYGAMP